MLAAANSQPHEGGVFAGGKQSLRIYWKQPFLSIEWRERAVDRPMVGGAVPCAPHGIINRVENVEKGEETPRSNKGLR